MHLVISSANSNVQIPPSGNKSKILAKQEHRTHTHGTDFTKFMFASSYSCGVVAFCNVLKLDQPGRVSACRGPILFLQAPIGEEYTIYPSCIHNLIDTYHRPSEINVGRFTESPTSAEATQIKN
jgi:hypothetical protein